MVGKLAKTTLRQLTAQAAVRAPGIDHPRGTAIADTKPQNEGGFFAKLKARLNRGTSWLAGDLLGLGNREIDEEMLEELETRLLMADVGVSATTWLLDEMRRRRGRGKNAAELLGETALELLAKVESPLEIRADTAPFVILVVGVNGTG